MPEDEQLDVLGCGRAADEQEQSEHVKEDQVQQTAATRRRSCPAAVTRPIVAGQQDVRRSGTPQGAADILAFVEIRNRNPSRLLGAIMPDSPGRKLPISLTIPILAGIGGLLLVAIPILGYAKFIVPDAKPSSWLWKLYEALGTIGILVISGVAIKLLLDRWADKRTDVAERTSKERDFLDRTRKAHVKTAAARDAMVIEDSLEAYTAQIGSIFLVKHDLEDIQMDLRHAHDLFLRKDGDSSDAPDLYRAGIICAIGDIIGFLEGVLADYQELRSRASAVSSARLKIKHESAGMPKLNSFIVGSNGCKDLPDEYNKPLGRSKGVMRHYVYGDGRPFVSDSDRSSGTKGTRVKITGMRFSGTEEVLFGSTPALDFKVVSDTEITATTPPAGGTVNIVVRNKIGTSYPTAQYTYEPSSSHSTRDAEADGLSLPALRS
ncbi:MAG: IPT/TIG domain-containing protein [Pseudonocardia sp.]